jgi:kynurenine formamidase
MPVLDAPVSAIRAATVEVIDLTAKLDATTPVIRLPEPFGNTKPFALHEISRYDERGPAWYWNDISTGEHTGTHFDAPVHWATGAGREDFLNADESGPHTPGISVRCAQWLALSPLIGLGVETVGTDAGAAHSVDPPFPCHSALLGAGKYGLTQLQNLALLPATGAVVIAGPLPIAGGSGSPCRALALVERS